MPVHYDAMIQSRGISRLNGDLYTPAAILDRVGAATARAGRAWKNYPAGEAPLALRACLCTTAVAGLAALIVMITSALP
jgi:hypothetical protein